MRLKLLFSISLVFTYSISIFAQATSWAAKGIGGGGAVQNPSISPFNNNRVFMSCDMSQMFETTDFGDNWQMFNFNNLQGGIRAKVCFTNDAQKLYAVGNTTAGTYVPKKSVDGGSTWTTMNPNPCVNFGAFQIYANPNDYNQFVISDKKSIYFTKDAGANFSTLETDNSNAGVHLAGAFFDGLNIYIASDKKLFISADGGTNFPTTIVNSSANISSNEGVVSFTGARQGGITKFYCTTITAANLTCKTYGFDVQYFVGLYEMRNPFSSWKNITSSLNASNVNETEKAYFVRTLPNDTSTVYIGGSVGIGVATYGTVFKSVNGGAAWSNKFLNTNTVTNNANITAGWVGNSSTLGYTHGWVSINTCEGLCIDPNDINRIVMTDKSNLHKSINGGTSWSQMYIKSADANAANSTFSASKEYATTGLETMVAYWLTWVDAANMIASCADITAIKSSDGGNKWGFNYNSANIYAGGSTKINDISMMIKDPKTGILYAATGDVVGSNGVWDDSRLSQSHGRICFSTDNGATWQIMHDFTRPVTYLHIDKNHPDTMYACVQDIVGGNIGGIYRCSSIKLGVSSVWTPLTAPARASKRPNNIYVLNDGNLMASYYPLDSTSNYNYAAKSGVFLSTDGGNSWQDRTDFLMQKKTYSIYPDPNDPAEQTWFACVGAGGANNSNGLWRSNNRGSSWTNITPGRSTLSVTFHPYLANEMYICTETNGLYYATNTNSFSFVPSAVTSYDFRNPQMVFFNPYDVNEVWIASFGNGLKMGTTSIITSSQEIKSSNVISVYPNPSESYVNVNSPDKNIVSLKVYNIVGMLVQEQGTSVINVEDFASGLYFISLQTDKGWYACKFTRK